MSPVDDSDELEKVFLDEGMKWGPKIQYAPKMKAKKSHYHPGECECPHDTKEKNWQFAHGRPSVYRIVTLFLEFQSRPLPPSTIRTQQTAPSMLFSLLLLQLHMNDIIMGRLSRTG